MPVNDFVAADAEQNCFLNKKINLKYPRHLQADGNRLCIVFNIRDKRISRDLIWVVRGWMLAGQGECNALNESVRISGWIWGNYWFILVAIHSSSSELL
jgi:hypothetical protein